MAKSLTLRNLLPLLILSSFFCVWGTVVAVPADARIMSHPEILPIVREGVEYSLIAIISHRDCADDQEKPCETQELVMAREKKSGHVLWKTALFKVIYNSHLVKDLQQVPVRSMAWTVDDEVKVIDDRGTVYRVDPFNGDLLAPAAQKTYDQSKNFDSNGYI